MNKIALTSAALVACLLATPAAAASDFDGARLEAHAGWDRVQVETAGTTKDPRKDGIMYGVGAGYDLAVGTTLRLGVEAELDFANAIEKVSGTTRLKSDAKRDFAAGIRVGAAVTDRFLLYVRAAYANARVKDDAITGVPGSATRTSSRDGLRFGAGAEYAVAKHVFLKAEYRYSNYERGLSRNQLVGGVGIRF
jgi:outer membrane immunogenic protein